MARVVCVDCDESVGSWVYGGYDSDGYGVRPVCDDCSGLFEPAA